jgi:uncharacterized protein YjiS (DUF1127 family)
MAHMETRDEHRASKGRLFRLELNSIATMIQAFRRWRRTVAGRRAIADMTPHELKDIGHPGVPIPKLDVKAGLITYLMSMR